MVTTKAILYRPRWKVAVFTILWASLSGSLPVREGTDIEFTAGGGKYQELRGIAGAEDNLVTQVGGCTSTTVYRHKGSWGGGGVAVRKGWGKERGPVFTGKFAILGMQDRATMLVYGPKEETPAAAKPLDYVAPAGILRAGYQWKYVGVEVGPGITHEANTTRAYVGVELGPRTTQEGNTAGATGWNYMFVPSAAFRITPVPWFYAYADLLDDPDIRFGPDQIGVGFQNDRVGLEGSFSPFSLYHYNGTFSGRLRLNEQVGVGLKYHIHRRSDTSDSVGTERQDSLYVLFSYFQPSAAPVPAPVPLPGVPADVDIWGDE